LLEDCSDCRVSIQRRVQQVQRCDFGVLAFVGELLSRYDPRFRVGRESIERERSSAGHRQ
jgi:hypothetical protein